MSDESTERPPMEGTQPPDPLAEGVSSAPPEVPAETGSSQPTSPEAAAEPESLRARAAKADENWDLYLRTRAEFDNYRRRSTRERQEAVRFASLGLIEKLLPVLDSFDMAMAATQTGGAAPLEALQQGITMVQSQLKKILNDSGLQEVNAAGQPFDPNLHEAVAHYESSEVADGHVLQQIRKGYLLHDRLVRPATVVVAKKPES